jgi:hypothetical protein
VAEKRSTETTLAEAFGRQRGWSLSTRPFSLKTLSLGRRHGGSRSYSLEEGNGYFSGLISSLFDHPYWYRRDGKAAAIVAHLYGWPSQKAGAETLARQTGLRVEAFEGESWWNPGTGGTTLIAYIGPAGIDAGADHA